MKNNLFPLSLLANAVICASAFGQVPNSSVVTLEEVVVTAQKRQESINDVPMSISAVSGDTMADRGIFDTADLVKVVPGFTASKTNSLSPVFTLRGVGLYLYDSGVGASPAVSIYIDEVGIPSPAMTSGLTFDLERVEVLKGPQGTLFGQNATGGAINYIASKPTDEFSAGTVTSYDENGKLDAQGYVSGPLTDTLRGRIALGTAQGGDWQKSLTRPGDELGDQDQVEARVLLDWEASDALLFQLNLTTAEDNGDTQAGAFTEYHPALGRHPNPAAQAALSATPIAPSDPKAADWTPGTNKANNSFDLASLRVDYDLNESMQLTSLTAYQKIDIDMTIDQDGSWWDNLIINPDGSSKTFSQELRVASSTDKLTWVVGANYETSDISNNLYYDTDLSFNYVFGPATAYQVTYSENDTDVDTYAAFAHAEYALTDNLTAAAGVRYTDSRRDAKSCTSGDAVLSSFINRYTAVVTGAPGSFVAGDCIMLESAENFVPTGEIKQSLDEDNTSWRFDLTYNLESDAILYANVSRGYKSGAIIPSGGLLASSYAPTTQESLTAYETGFKAPFFDNRVQLNGAAFYYDYEDKQVPARVFDPVFRALPGLANVPKSEIKGAELQFVTRPMAGLDINFSATYLDAEVTDDYFIVTGADTFINLEGADLPNTPEWSYVGDIQYRWSLTANMEMYIGGSVTYVDDTLSRFPDTSGVPPVLPDYTIYDVRAGLASADDVWNVQVWGRNIGDEYYTFSDSNSIDTSYRYAGKGETYGLTLTYRM